jgi:hypothetical protein
MGNRNTVEPQNTESRLNRLCALVTGPVTRTSAGAQQRPTTPNKHPAAAPRATAPKFGALASTPTTFSNCKHSVGLQSTNAGRESNVIFLGAGHKLTSDQIIPTEHRGSWAAAAVTKEEIDRPHRWHNESASGGGSDPNAGVAQQWAYGHAKHDGTGSSACRRNVGGRGLPLRFPGRRTALVCAEFLPYPNHTIESDPMRR